MQKNLVQNSGTRWYFSCTVYIFSADDIFRKVAENPEKSTILANIPRYLQIYIPAGPHWGGRGRTFKSCHSDQNRRFNRTSDFCFVSTVFRFRSSAFSSRKKAMQMHVSTKILTNFYEFFKKGLSHLKKVPINCTFFDENSPKSAKKLLDFPALREKFIMNKSKIILINNTEEPHC